MSFGSWTFITLVIISATIGITSCNSEPTIDYSTQVKPILNKNCLACHGGVRKQAGLSFLFEEEALAELESGNYAIVPGNAKQSEMIRRLTLEDPELRMPFEHDPLTDSEIELLTTWIEQGAEWGRHWAYQSIEEIDIPENNIEWGTNAIDQFIASGFIAKDLEPSPQAEPTTLSLSLIHI